jgi:manganese transport protein
MDTKKLLDPAQHHPKLDFFKYIGPGLLVTVGFIDPGNWASNVAAGSQYGYTLLWMVTLSTIMLIILQHNAAHLGIATGYCLSESATMYLKPWLSKVILISAMLAAVSTAMAEILGGAIALNMLFGLPIKLGSLLVLALVVTMLFTNSYKRLEKIIVGFVSLVGISFLIEVSMVQVPWTQAAVAFVVPSFPEGSIPVIMSVLGAVVMPHNLFLHSEVIQSRQWNLESDAIIQKQLKYEFMDTLLSMIIGWAINSAMIIVAAATFFAGGLEVTELSQAQSMLTPLLGGGASILFALALLFAGISSSMTAGMAGGSIYAGMNREPYDIGDFHTKVGVLITLVVATVVIFFVTDPYQGLIYSQMFLSVQLPISIFLQVYLTSSKKVMKNYANTTANKVLLLIIGGLVTLLNVMLLINTLA